jgi:thymidine phosphorylase
MVLARPGTRVKTGDGVLELHYRDRARLASAEPLVGSAIVIADAAPPPSPLILGEVS